MVILVETYITQVDLLTYPQALDQYSILNSPGAISKHKRTMEKYPLEKFILFLKNQLKSISYIFSHPRIRAHLVYSSNPLT